MGNSEISKILKYKQQFFIGYLGVTRISEIDISEIFKILGNRQ